MPQIEWYNPTRAKERILGFGIPGCGKTASYLQVLQKVAGDKYIVELDNTLDEFLVSPEFEDLTVKEEWLNGEQQTDYCVEDGKLVLHRIHNGDWKLFRKTFENLKTVGEDWVVIDGGDKPWEWVVDWYLEQMYGRDLGMQLLIARQELIKEKKAGHGAMEKLIREWEPINAEYRTFANWLLNVNCNVMIVTGQKKLTDMQNDKMVRNEFGGIGVMPTGQKHLAGQVRTVLWFQKLIRSGGDKYMIRTVKDRQRKTLDDVEWTDGNFFDLFLKRGWKPRSV